MLSGISGSITGVYSGCTPLKVALTIGVATVGCTCYAIYSKITNLFDGAYMAQAFDQQVKDFGFSDRVEHLEGEVMPALEHFSEMISNTLAMPFDKISDRVQEIASKVLQNFTLRSVPWIALSTTMLLGPPVLMKYGYDRLKHNIGKPKLAQEMKSYHLIDRTISAVSNTLAGVYSRMKLYLKWKYGTLAAICTGSFFHAMSIGMYRLFVTGDIGTKPASAKFLNDVFCKMDNFFINLENELNSEKSYLIRGVCRESDRQWLSYDSVVAAATCLATGMVFYSLFKTFKKYIRENWIAIPKKPIFAPAVKERIDDITQSVKNLKKHDGYLQNVLLYGPGGTGKTMISKYIARNSGMNYVMMSGGDLAQYIKRGEHVTELNRLFERANASAGATILFIDEAESLCRDRSKMNKEELFELINAFLNQTGEPSKKVMLIMATNRLEDIDPAVLSRMDHKIEVAPPQLAERKQILQMYLSHFFSSSEIKKFFNDEVLHCISEQTEGLTGRALFKMLNALSTKKKCTNDNRLTPELVAQVVTQFVDQEQQVREAIAKVA